MRLVIRKDRQPVTAPDIVIYERSYDNYSGLVFSYSMVFDNSKTMLSFA